MWDTGVSQVHAILLPEGGALRQMVLGFRWSEEVLHTGTTVVVLPAVVEVSPMLVGVAELEEPALMEEIHLGIII